MKLSQIRKNPNNPRIIRDEKFKKLKRSIQDFPQMMELRPIIVDEAGVILGGNMRYEAIKSLKMSEFPDEWVKRVEELTEEQKKEFIVKDNVGFGDWDWDAIANEWDDLPLDDWGLEVPSIEAVEPLEAVEDEFDTTPPVEAITVLGDLYEIGEHRLLCGDSTSITDVERLMDGKKADMVFTSPPYNGNTSVGFAGSGLANQDLYIDNSTDAKNGNDYIQFNLDIFNTIKPIASNDLVLFYNINYNRNSPSEYIDVVSKGKELFQLVETIIWEKSMAISLAGDNLTRIYEFIFVFFNGKDKPKLNKTHTNECVKNLWKISNISANTDEHKACFPVELPFEAIKYYARDNALVFEPFTGSGSTMVAAHQLHRKCYGMELEPKYCDVIVKRMKALDADLVVKRNGEWCEDFD